MSQVAGYINSVSTPYGIANFWVVTDLHYVANVGTALTLSGYPTETDANTIGTIPMGTYVIALTPLQTFTLFAGGQGLVATAITTSSPAWAGATFVPASG